MNAIKGFFVRMATAVVKPFLKRQVIAVVQKEGDILQTRVLFLYDREGPAGVDRAFDGAQLKLIGLLHNIRFLPDWLRKAAIAIIQDEGDKLQAATKKAAATGGHLAIEKAFDAAQEAIIYRIEAL